MIKWYVAMPKAEYPTTQRDFPTAKFFSAVYVILFTEFDSACPLYSICLYTSFSEVTKKSFQLLSLYDSEVMVHKLEDDICQLII